MFPKGQLHIKTGSIMHGVSLVYKMLTSGKLFEHDPYLAALGICNEFIGEGEDKKSIQIAELEKFIDILEHMVFVNKEKKSKKTEEKKPKLASIKVAFATKKQTRTKAKRGRPKKMPKHPLALENYLKRNNLPLSTTTIKGEI